MLLGIGRECRTRLAGRARIGGVPQRDGDRAGARGFIRIGGNSGSTFSTVNHPADSNSANAALVPLPTDARSVQLASQGGRSGTRQALNVDISGFFTV